MTKEYLENIHLRWELDEKNPNNVGAHGAPCPYFSTLTAHTFSSGILATGS